jgi:hypothetical protein
MIFFWHHLSDQFICSFVKSGDISSSDMYFF